MEDKLTKEEREELRKKEKEEKEPMIEEKRIPLIENRYKVNDKEVYQHKINIPKNFADFINLKKGKHEVVSKLDKKNKRIIIEIYKNEK